MCYLAQYKEATIVPIFGNKSENCRKFAVDFFDDKKSVLHERLFQFIDYQSAPACGLFHFPTDRAVLGPPQFLIILENVGNERLLLARWVLSFLRQRIHVDLPVALESCWDELAVEMYLQVHFALASVKASDFVNVAFQKRAQRYLLEQQPQPYNQRPTHY